MVDRGFGLDARAGFAVGGLSRRLERPLVRIGHTRKGQPVIPLLDGFVCLLHRRRGGLERFGRVLLGASGARGFDGALCAIDFLLGRSGAGNSEEHRADRDDGTSHRTEV